MHQAAGFLSGPTSRTTAIARSPDLVSLMERVKASMALVESALAREAPAGDQETTAGIFVLDDVTPRYARARAALNACSAGLGAALHALLDTSASSQETSAPAECGLAFADRA